MANSRNSSTSKKKEYTIDQVKKKLRPKILMPEDNDNFFKNIIGNKDIVEQLTEIVALLNSGSEIEILGVPYHPSFVMLGMQGVGKTLTTFAFAKEMNLPIIAINCERIVQDYSEEMFEGIIKLVRSVGKCVVMFKEIQFFANMKTEDSISIYNMILDVKEAFPESFFFVSASVTTTYPAYFMGEEGFDTMISFNPPGPEDREALIRKFLEELPYVENLDIPKLARDFFGFSGGDIKCLLKKAFIQAMVEEQEELTYEIINQTMYSDMFGKKISKMSEKELHFTAYHEAGHVIAGYYALPDYKVSKVEVAYRSYSLGITDPEVDEKKLSTTKKDLKGEIIHSLGGKCAEQIIFGTSTSGVMQDLQQATALADGYVCKFGMDETFGPVYVDDDEYFSDALKSIADIKVQELMISLERKTTDILREHKDTLINLAETLAKKETLYKDEIIQILEGSKKESKKTAKPKNPPKKAKNPS